jgi:hydrogenase maturation protease
MTQQEPSRIVVIGVGNVLLTDEGVGAHVVHQLAELDLPSAVELIEGGTMPVECLGCVADIARLVIVDAVDGGGPPGAIYRLPVAEVVGTTPQMSLHELTLAEALTSWHRRGLDESRTVIIGIQPHTIAWGTELSQPLAQKMPIILDTVVAEVLRKDEE